MQAHHPRAEQKPKQRRQRIDRRYGAHKQHKQRHGQIMQEFGQFADHAARHVDQCRAEPLEPRHRATRKQFLGFLGEQRVEGGSDEQGHGGKGVAGDQRNRDADERPENPLDERPTLGDPGHPFVYPSGESVQAPADQRAEEQHVDRQGNDDKGSQLGVAEQLATAHKTACAVNGVTFQFQFRFMSLFRVTPSLTGCAEREREPSASHDKKPSGA